MTYKSIRETLNQTDIIFRHYFNYALPVNVDCGGVRDEAKNCLGGRVIFCGNRICIGAVLVNVINLSARFFRSVCQ